MSKSILEAVREERAKSLAKSADFAEAVERTVHDKAQYVKVMMTGDMDGHGEHGLAMHLSYIYFRMMEDYTGKKKYSKPTWNARSIAEWERVAAAVAKSECEPEEYMKAQFLWFHKAYGKPPTRVQLMTELAIQRAIDYRASTDKSEHRVVANAQPANISNAEILKQCEVQVRQIMKAQKCTSREDFYRRFVKTGVITLPKVYLERDPAWKAVQ